jgi:hypothetical protein
MSRFAFVYALFCLAGLADPTKQPARKPAVSVHTRASSQHPAAKSSSLTASHRVSSGKSASSDKAVSRGGDRKVVVVRKKVHGQWVRVTRIVHSPPAPSYQTHPDPDRYKEIQQALAAQGYFRGDQNGQWGDDSVDALKRFQADHNLPNDGKINSLSLIGLGLGPHHDTTGPAPPPASTVSQNQ